MQHVMIAQPRYGSAVDYQSMLSALVQPTKKYRVNYVSPHSSLLGFGFNLCWKLGLEQAAAGAIDYFVMLHCDIAPEAGWVDTLVDEYVRVDADMLSAVVPLKDNSGSTSTAIAGDTPWRARKRLTLKEIDALPETFTAADAGYPNDALLTNTGCWIADLRKPFWRTVNSEGELRYSFSIRDRMRVVDGEVIVEVESEDWRFARLLHEDGRRVFATRKLELTHLGNWSWSNQGAWGEEVDRVTSA